LPTSAINLTFIFASECTDLYSWESWTGEYCAGLQKGVWPG